MTDWNFTNPPVWEVGLAALTDTATVLDDYDVALVHRLMGPGFPRAERQAPVGPMAPFVVAGEQQLGPTIQFEPVNFPAPTRWWFTSEDGRNLIQIQDQFLARNWRKTSPVPIGDQSYPTFDGLLSSYFDMLGALVENAKEREREFPNPALFDLLYVNIIPLVGADNKQLKVRDVLPMISFDDDVMKAGITMQWQERISGKYSDLALQIQIHVLAIAGIAGSDGEVPRPVVRLSLNARAPTHSWDEFRELAVYSHAYMRERLLALTTPAVRATWNS